MISLDRETAMMVAIVVSLLASAYLYKEFQKQKTDMSTLKNYTANVPMQMSTVSNVSTPLDTSPKSEKIDPMTENNTE